MKSNAPRFRPAFGPALGLGIAIMGAVRAAGQGLPALAPAAETTTQSATFSAPSNDGPEITLDEALNRARANEPAFAAAVAASKVADLDRSIAKSELLPSATYHNQALYTQPNGAHNSAGSIGSQPAPKFIANNAVREYASQGVFNETLGLQQFNALSLASAQAAVAHAELEVTRRGLVATVVGLYYTVSSAQSKLAIAQRAQAEAAAFTRLTTEREAAREAAHADVVKAQLQQQQRDRDLADAALAANKAKLELGVLLFADPRSSYHVVASLNPPALAPRAEIEAAAAKLNPELQSALASLRVSTLGITAARAAYLPNLGLNFTYGIDAEQIAVNGPEGVRNLGYSFSGSLDIPVWDWFATAHRVKQAEIQRDSARVALTATQRRLIAQLEEAYAEASAARDQLASLDQSVETAAESLRLTRLRYASGEATVLEVVDAQNSLTTAELARADGNVRYQTALAQLQTLTGTL
jgi:outer membrane protein TolC